MRSKSVASSQPIWSGALVLTMSLGLGGPGARPLGAQETTTQAMERSRVTELADLRRRSMNEDLSIEARSTALDQALEVREDCDDTDG